MIIGQPTGPLHVVFSANASDKNFEIATCLKIVQRSYNKAIGDDRISWGRGERVLSFAPGAYKVFMEGVVL